MVQRPFQAFGITFQSLSFVDCGAEQAQHNRGRLHVVFGVEPRSEDYLIIQRCTKPYCSLGWQYCQCHHRLCLRRLDCGSGSQGCLRVPCVGSCKVHHGNAMLRCYILARHLFVWIVGKHFRHCGHQPGPAATDSSLGFRRATCGRLTQHTVSGVLRRSVHESSTSSVYISPSHC